MVRMIILAAALLFAPALLAQETAPKNVIIFIGDGMGFNHVEATDYYLTGTKDSSPFAAFETAVAASTYSAENDGTPTGYDPEQAWTSLAYLKARYTDSGAAGTALATGEKTYDGAIGVGVDERRLTNLLEVAEELGKATGVATSVQLSHATPAAFVAHNPNRRDYVGIAREMFLDSDVDLIMGAGHPLYDGSGELADDPNYDYVGGEAVWNALLAGETSVAVEEGERSIGDADGDGAPDAWTLVETRGDFVALSEGETPKRVAGVVRNGSTLQANREPSSEAPFETPFVETIPTLAEMTAAALNVLDDDPDGFVLMIEGGAIDWASHANDKSRLIEETADFYDAIRAAATWAEHNGATNETLVVVTADHECGALWGETPLSPVENNGEGALPTMTFFSDSHTNALVPLYATGPGAEAFHEYANETDPKRGAYVDNTEIPRVIMSLLRGKAK
ncbi:MAG: alkaline phosphatase [Ignavibacteriales bacterium]|nr:alkaline phosphatase [Ignavibacteriales bacterium]